MRSPMNSPLEVELLDWTRAAAQARPVRTRVFVDEQGVPAAMEWDEWDAVSIHAIAKMAGQVAGTGRLLPADEQGAVHIGRMAVLKSFRRQGVGAAILAALMAHARRQGAREAVLHAQTYAAGFYRRLGFTSRGNEFREVGIPHVEMACPLANADHPRDATG